MQEEEFCLEILKKTQEEQYPVFQIAAHTANPCESHPLPNVNESAT